MAVEDAGTYLCHASNGVGKEKILPVPVEVVGEFASLSAFQDYTWVLFWWMKCINECMYLFFSK